MSKHGFPKSLPKETGTKLNKTAVSPQNSKMEKKSGSASVDPRKTSIRFADDTIGAEENIMGQKKKDHQNPDKGKSMNLPHKAGKKNCQPNKKLRATFSSPLDDHDTESVQSSLDDSVVPRSLPVEKPGAFVVDGPQSFSVNNHNVGTELINQGDNDVEQQRTASDESTLVSATLVDESEQPILAKAAPIDGAYRTWKFLLLAALIFLILSAAIGMPLIMKSRKDDNLISQSPTSVPSPLPTVSLAPSSSPTILPGPRKAFETAEELRLAVDAYLLDGSPNSQVSQKYGYPIGDWNVAQITDFSNVFSFRNANIALFNEDISSWDVSRAVSMESMFEGASLFNQPIEKWNVSSVSNMKKMFCGASNFNEPLDAWDVSQVTDMSFLFNGATFFNQPLGTWNVSSVVQMDAVFWRAVSFSQELGDWDVSNVKYLGGTFWDAHDFNSPLDEWDVSSVMFMDGTFSGATSFNNPLSNWNVSNVIRMDNMFFGASAFNQPLSSWDVSRVKTAFGMFGRAASFNQALNEWTTSSIEDMGFMFAKATSFNQDLSTWDVSSVENMDKVFWNAASFNQSLCVWTTQLEKETNVTDAFKNSGCPETSTPILGGSSNTTDHFCHVC